MIAEHLKILEGRICEFNKSVPPLPVGPTYVLWDFVGGPLYLVPRHLPQQVEGDKNQALLVGGEAPVSIDGDSVGRGSRI